MTEATGRPHFRVFFGLAAALFVAVGASLKLHWFSEPNHLEVLVVPLLVVFSMLFAAYRRIDSSPWRVETPFVAATLVVLGPSWALGAWAAGWLGALGVRGGRMSSRRAIQEFGGITLAAGLSALWLSYLEPIPIAVAVLFSGSWLVSVQLLKSHALGRIGPIAAPILFAASLAGLLTEGPTWWILIGVVPTLLMATAALGEMRVERNLDQTMQALALMLQRAHPYTHAHIERVARVAQHTARNLGLSEQRAQHVHDAARFHDIGKIAIDEQILDKPGKLSPEEFEHVKLHAPFGATILEEIRDFRHLAGWIRNHHERPDGSGYPNGLKGDQIPIEARIIAVADAFDAMTGGFGGGDRRPYRDPILPQEALEELERCAGTQFDPKVVAAFRQALNEETSAP